MTQGEDQKWIGRSDEIAVPMLGAEFWKDGTEVSGVLESRREQQTGGPAFKLTLDNPVLVDGEEADVVELPSMKGIRTALQALALRDYKPRKGDLWRVVCVKVKKAKREDYSDSPEFEIGVIRKAAA